MAANDYLKYKWRLWFQAIDSRHDGKIYREDKVEEGEKFVETYQLENKQKKRIQDNLNKMYNDFVFKGKHSAITEQEFVDMQNKEFLADKKAFEDKMRKCGEVIYAVFDINGKGSLTEDEFVHAATIGSYEHVDQVRAIFQSKKTIGGKVNINVLTEAWVHFSTCEDSTKLDIVKLGMESFLGDT